MNIHDLQHMAEFWCVLLFSRRRGVFRLWFGTDLDYMLTVDPVLQLL